MISRKEALTQSVENTELFKVFEAKLRCAVEDGQFSVELRHPDIDSEEPSSFALVSYLRDRGYEVSWNDVINIITVSWF